MLFATWPTGQTPPPPHPNRKSLVTLLLSAKLKVVSYDATYLPNYILVADLPLARVKVGNISRSPRTPFEYFGEPFSNLISLDNQYLGKTIYFSETESIIW